MIEWISAEVYMLVAGVTGEKYVSMYTPTMEQLFQVSQALTELPWQLSGRVVSLSLVLASK